MDLLSMISGLFTSSSSVDALSAKAGTDSSQTKGILSAALPMLFSALTSNASSESGASSLLGALMQHTSTASMDEQIKNADEEDGKKIISHILGNNQNSVIQSISEKTGAQASQISALLSNMAPGMLSGISAVTSAASKKTQAAAAAKAQAAAKVQAAAKAQAAAAAEAQAAKVEAAAKEQAAKRVPTAKPKTQPEAEKVPAAAAKLGAAAKAQTAAAKVQAAAVNAQAAAVNAQAAAVNAQAAAANAQAAAEAKAAAEAQAAAQAKPAGLDLGGMLGLFGLGGAKEESSGGLGSLLGGLLGGGSGNDADDDASNPLLGALKTFLK